MTAYAYWKMGRTETRALAASVVIVSVFALIALL